MKKALPADATVNTPKAPEENVARKSRESGADLEREIIHLSPFPVRELWDAIKSGDSAKQTKKQDA